MTDRTLTMERLVRYRCGQYGIECGPGQTWRWVNRPIGIEDLRESTADDLTALAIVTAAADSYLRTNPKGEE